MITLFELATCVADKRPFPPPTSFADQEVLVSWDHSYRFKHACGGSLRPVNHTLALSQLRASLMEQNRYIAAPFYKESIRSSSFAIVYGAFLCRLLRPRHPFHPDRWPSWGLQASGSTRTNLLQLHTYLTQSEPTLPCPISQQDIPQPSFAGDLPLALIRVFGNLALRLTPDACFALQHLSEQLPPFPASLPRMLVRYHLRYLPSLLPDLRQEEFKRVFPD